MSKLNSEGAAERRPDFPDPLLPASRNLFPSLRSAATFTAHRSKAGATMSIERIPNPELHPDAFSGGQFRGPRPLPIGPLTAVLIGLCVVVAIFSKLGKVDEVVEHFFITRGEAAGTGVMLPEIAQGQVWRLLTPIFLHFGIMHLVFNLLWLKDLGTIIERLASTRLLFGLVLVSGVLSNIGQFEFAGPFFGGMSGVVYALLGFVWMKSRFDPASGFHLEKQTVIMMIGWFFLCMTGAVGNVANFAHGFGLGIGMIWGFVSAKIHPARARGLIFP
jgi:GlpG protein